MREPMSAGLVVIRKTMPNSKAAMVSTDVRSTVSWIRCCIDSDVLSSRETWWLANGTQLQTRQPQLLLLLYENQRDAKLSRYAVAAIGCLLDLTACQDGGIAVNTHLDLVQAERLVLQVTRLMSRDPLLLGQHESERPYTNEVI